MFGATNIENKNITELNKIIYKLFFFVLSNKFFYTSSTI